MSGLSHYAVQAAIHAVLESDAELAGCVEGVFDYVPAKTAYPYLRMGRMQVTDISIQTKAIQRIELDIHCYSRMAGSKEVQDIMGKIYALLHDSTPEMEDCHCIDVRMASSDVQQERDGKTYHGRMRFIITVQEETP